MKSLLDYAHKYTYFCPRRCADAVVIAIAETDEEIRVISMRKAERHEEKIYYSKL